MGDSDDEYDRKRRDKFRGERTEGYSRESRRGSTEGRRDDYERDDNWGGGRAISRPSRPEYRDYRGGARERYSPTPPVKRFKPEGWDDRRYAPDYGYGSSWPPEYPDRPYPPPMRRVEPVAAVASPADTQPAMMSFKAFLAQQDDTITDEEAIAKYNDYKLEFKRQQLNEFFVTHKDEEWFKFKYHPEDSVKRKEEQLNYLKQRVVVFTEFLGKGLLEDIRLDAEQTDALVRLMDRLVIRLEGGSEVDWLALEAEEAPAKQNEQPAGKPEGPVVVDASDDEKDKPEIKKEPKDADEEEKDKKEDGEEEEEKKKKDKEDGESKDEAKSDNEKDDNEDEASTSGKRKRGSAYGYDSGSDSDGDKSKKDDASTDAEKKNGRKGERKSRSGSPSQSNDDVTEVEHKRKDLHKTASVFLRTLAPTITKAEVESMCRRYPGFLRVALADPQAERRWFRRGWVTFERFVNIKEICWNLNNIRLRDCELGAIVNKDLTRRVRTVAGVASHKQVVRNDIKLAARMTHTLDSRNGLWQEEAKANLKKETQSFGLVSANPVLENITDYLIEEASAEEEELLGLEGETGGQSSECTVERDENLIRVLDRLLLYLRIVFSIDYYNHCEYPQEDEMPNRCGLIHVRGPPPSTKVTQGEIHDYCKQFEQKISSLVTPNNLLTPEEIAKHGAKNADKEVEKFIQANTQELSKDKWLCPLSGKKFKGPDFVRKHIQNKHAEKVQEVIKEVEYFNHYLADPRRPMLPEHPTSKPAMKREPEPYAPPAAAAAPAFAPPAPAYGYPPRGGYGGYGGFGGYRGMRGGFRGRALPPPVHELRPVVHYRDLDAPRELDEFI